MKSKYFYLLFIVLFAGTGLVYGNGTADISVGYIVSDEDGNVSVNQETYNVYEDFALSIRNFKYMTSQGINFRGDFINTTLENRKLSFNSFKSGLFDLSFYNTNYRRVYNNEGTDFTERERIGLSGKIYAHKHFTLFGGYSNTDKNGTIYQSFSPYSDINRYTTDYSYKSYNFGLNTFCDYAKLRTEYYVSKYDGTTVNIIDPVNPETNVYEKESKKIKLTGFSKIPKIDKLNLFGGFIHRTDSIQRTNSSVSILKTKQAYGGLKYYINNNESFEYRLLFARSDHSEYLFETDNWVNSLTYSKKWVQTGGVRVSVESRIVDDLIDRTEAKLFVIDGWYKVGKNLLFKGKTSLRNREVVTGTTLEGDQSYSRHLFSVRYTDNRYGDVTLRLDKRIRKNEDIGTRVDYSSATTTGNLKLNNLGNLQVTYSYYLGEYENTNAVTDFKSYEFSDHIFTGSVLPDFLSEYELEFGGTYYRSRRDQNIEKFSLHTKASYNLYEDYKIQVKYDVFNYDDYMLNGNYYTANIIEINIIKGISF